MPGVRVSVSEIHAAGGFERWHERMTREANAHPFSGFSKMDHIDRTPKANDTKELEKKSGYLAATTPHRSEHDEQAMVIARADALSATVPVLRLLHAIPNGGARSKATAGKLKAEGVRPGVPDLMLPVACHGYHGLYIEMKAGGGRTSDEQKRWHKDLRQNGYQVEVCVGADAAWSVLCGYLGIRG